MHSIKDEEYNWKMGIIFNNRTFKVTFGAMVFHLLILYRTSFNERTTSAKQWFITLTTKNKLTAKQPITSTYIYRPVLIYKKKIIKKNK